jgi:hypothetical protein
MTQCEDYGNLRTPLNSTIMLNIPKLKELGLRKMDVAVKRSRSMLLLFPAEVVHSVAPIRDTMAAYAKSVGQGKGLGHGF